MAFLICQSCKKSWDNVDYLPAHDCRLEKNEQPDPKRSAEPATTSPALSGGQVDAITDSLNKELDEWREVLDDTNAHWVSFVRGNIRATRFALALIKQASVPNGTESEPTAG